MRTGGKRRVAVTVIAAAALAGGCTAAQAGRLLPGRLLADRRQPTVSWTPGQPHRAGPERGSGRQPGPSSQPGPSGQPSKPSPSGQPGPGGQPSPSGQPDPASRQPGPGGQPAPSGYRRPAQDSSAVGALFSHGGSGRHFCTASVVDSPGRDLLITAAHCINGGEGAGYRRGIVFVPGYRDGHDPFGIWEPAELIVAPGWAAGRDPALDVGFIVLRPLHGRNIEDVLGAAHLGIDPGYRNLVRVTGYPASGGAPITCRNWTSRQSASQLRFHCAGFTAGTSGSPWITDSGPRARAGPMVGTIVGVIGGYQRGGDTGAVSYSPYLGGQIERLYREAVTDETRRAG